MRDSQNCRTFTTIGFTILTAMSFTVVIGQDQKPKRAPAKTYLPVVSDKSFQEIYEADTAAKEKVMAGQQTLLEKRYDLSEKPSLIKMSAGRKSVQSGVRVKLPDGVTWADLSEMTPEEIKEKNLFPMGFRPLPHTKHAVGGQVIPAEHIEVIAAQRGRLHRIRTAHRVF